MFSFPAPAWKRDNDGGAETGVCQAYGARLETCDLVAYLCVSNCLERIGTLTTRRGYAAGEAWKSHGAAVVVFQEPGIKCTGAYVVPVAQSLGIELARLAKCGESKDSDSR